VDKIKTVIRRKQSLFLIISLAYTGLIIALKLLSAPSLSVLWFALGAVMGIYFLDLAEEFFKLDPSPFRSIIFCAGFAVVSLFVITSSGSPLASGLVLIIYLTILMWQIGQWRLTGNLNSWYRMIASPVSPKAQLWGLMIFSGLFLLETIQYIRMP
jgi:hypothetical protein